MGYEGPAQWGLSLIVQSRTHDLVICTYRHRVLLILAIAVLPTFGGVIQRPLHLVVSLLLPWSFPDAADALYDEKQSCDQTSVLLMWRLILLSPGRSTGCLTLSLIRVAVGHGQLPDHLRVGLDGPRLPLE